MDKSPPPAFDIAIDKLIYKGYRFVRTDPDSTGATCYLVKRTKGGMSYMSQVEWIEDTDEVIVHEVN